MSLIADRAQEFLIKYDLPIKPRLADINTLCDDMGIQLLSYSQGETLINDVGAQNCAESLHAFTLFLSEKAIIFYDDKLDYEDKIFTLLHEIGHIYLKHTYSGVLGFSGAAEAEGQEKEANAFALCVLGPPAILDRCGAHTIKKIEGITGLSRKYSPRIAALAADFDRSENPASCKKIEKKYRKNILSAFLRRYRGRLKACLMVLIMCVVVIMGYTIFRLANPPKTVYVAQRGRVYHLADCYHIKGVKTVEMTEEQAIAQYCAPCKDCDP